MLTASKCIHAYDDILIMTGVLLVKLLLLQISHYYYIARLYGVCFYNNYCADRVASACMLMTLITIIIGHRHTYQPV